MRDEDLELEDEIMDDESEAELVRRCQCGELLHCEECLNEQG